MVNLTPDKQHSDVVRAVQPLMKDGAALGYSHGFNIVEVGEQIRKDITVVMVAPKCPGTEVREEYKRGFGVPTLIAVHPENDPKGEGMAIAKAWAAATGGHRAGVLESSFVAEVKSDLMGEQTILCGMLQAGSLLCFDKLVEEGTDPAYAEKLIQFGWETITEALKTGRHYPDDGPFVQPGETARLRVVRAVESDHGTVVPETYGRHHLRRVLLRYDGGLGER
ncbi:ketol-acid reductoisomerase [Salmonella bongori]|nr:ketol-acid reductoisomerase [Salmonella bongori]